MLFLCWSLVWIWIENCHVGRISQCVARVVTTRFSRTFTRKWRVFTRWKLFGSVGSVSFFIRKGDTCPIFFPERHLRSRSREVQGGDWCLCCGLRVLGWWSVMWVRGLLWSFWSLLHQFLNIFSNTHYSWGWMEFWGFVLPFWPSHSTSGLVECWLCLLLLLRPSWAHLRWGIWSSGRKFLTFHRSVSCSW